MKRGNESKPHIGIFGRCNVGKSTLLNFLTAESVAIVSSQRGTTTDPVRRSMEIADFAPVVIIDTAGTDDNTLLGAERKKKSIDTLSIVDLAMVVYMDDWGKYEQEIVQNIEKMSIPYIVIHNSVDDIGTAINERKIAINLHKVPHQSRDLILQLVKDNLPEYSYVIPSMFGEGIKENEMVVLVCPIDSEAPAGRLILPQAQAIRDLLDKNSVSIVIQPEQLRDILIRGWDIKLIVTDSQIIDVVNREVAGTLPVTTFSILLAQMKGDMDLYSKGLEKVEELEDGDKILMLESCSHQSSCEDIGRVKIPMWLRHYTKRHLEFDYVTKLSALNDDLSQYAMAVQCGGCMVTPRQIKGRIHKIAAQGIPITNYGMLISKIKK